MSAQQLPLYSQYMFNNYLLNSAACGTTDYSMIKLNYRDQWSGFGNDAVGGFDPSPKTYSISFNKGLTNHSAIGFIVAQDQILPIQNTSFQVTYAYRFALSNKLYMSLAISPVYSILSFDNDIIEPDDITDPLYTDVSTLEMIGMENSSNIDFNFGMYFNAFNMACISLLSVWHVLAAHTLVLVVRHSPQTIILVILLRMVHNWWLLFK